MTDKDELVRLAAEALVRVNTETGTKPWDVQAAAVVAAIFPEVERQVKKKYGIRESAWLVQYAL